MWNPHGKFIHFIPMIISKHKLLNEMQSTSPPTSQAATHSAGLFSWNPTTVFHNCRTSWANLFRWTLLPYAFLWPSNEEYTSSESLIETLCLSQYSNCTFCCYNYNCLLYINLSIWHSSEPSPAQQAHAASWTPLMLLRNPISSDFSLPFIYMCAHSESPWSGPIPSSKSWSSLNAQFF